MRVRVEYVVVWSGEMRTPLGPIHPSKPVDWPGHVDPLTVAPPRKPAKRYTTGLRREPVRSSPRWQCR